MLDECTETKQCICCGEFKRITSFENVNHGTGRSTRCNVCKKHKHRVNKLRKIPASERTATEQKQLRVSEAYLYRCHILTGYNIF